MGSQNFFSEYVEKVLQECGLSYLTPAEKGHYIPQITRLLEERVGLELLPKLKKNELALFHELVKGVRTTPRQWKEFWTKAVPNFEEEMSRILAGFATTAKRRLCP